MPPKKRIVKHSAYTRERMTKAQEARERFIDLVAGGLGPWEAAEAIGKSVSWYESTRTHHPQWAQKVTAVRLARSDKSLRGFDFVDFRKVYFDNYTAPHHYRMIEAIETTKPGAVTAILAFPGAGKGLALDTALPTPGGWTTMQDIQVGDLLLDEQGDPTTVTAISQVTHRDCYRITFAGGQTITTDDQHRWLVRERNLGNNHNHDERIVTTADMYGNHLKYGRPVYSIPVTQPLQLADAELPINPYILGIWLGDGTTSAGHITSSTADAAEMSELIQDCGYTTGAAQYASIRITIYGLQAELRQQGLLHNKHVPAIYQRGSYKQRLALLQGLMDTDGTVDSKGRCNFNNTNRRLIDAVQELAVGLGFKASTREGRSTFNGKDCGPKWDVNFTPRHNEQIFRLQRKQERCHQRPIRDNRAERRQITNIEKVPTVATKCVAVDSPNSLYLATESLLPTHNTTLLTDKYCHLLAEDPNTRICVISEGQDLSRKIIGQVSDRMSDRERFLAYHMRYGPFRPQAWEDNAKQERDPLKRPWTADYFRVLAANSDQKEPSLESRGTSGRLYGARYDWMVYDDPQSNETLSKTPALLQSFRTTWKSRTIHPDGKLGKHIWIGSRCGPGDIYEEMEERELFSSIVTIPALDINIPREEHFTRVNGKIVVNPNCAAKPTWDRMSLETLAQLRWDAGEENWARTYMQDVVADAASVFTDEMLEKAKDRTRTVGPHAQGVDVWASMDPALDSGTCAYMMAAISPDALSVLDCMGRTDTRTYADSIDWISRWSGVYHPSMWIIEENNYQKGLLQDDRLETVSRRHNFDVLAHRTGRNKGDAVMGVRMMANAFLDGEISIPWGNEETIEKMSPLINELRAWRPKKRGSELKMDRVMTLWFLWMRWQQERQAMTNVIPLLPRPSWVRSA